MAGPYSPSGFKAEIAAGYYFEAGNIVHTTLLEEAREPSEEGWGRMRVRAFKAFDEWQAGQAGRAMS